MLAQKVTKKGLCDPKNSLAHSGYCFRLGLLARLLVFHSPGFFPEKKKTGVSNGRTILGRSYTCRNGNQNIDSMRKCSADLGVIWSVCCFSFREVNQVALNCPSEQMTISVANMQLLAKYFCKEIDLKNG
ncbi:MAG: hypothetical protein ABIQ11_03890 [Saprospiraceae bacterium]